MSRRQAARKALDWAHDEYYYYASLHRVTYYGDHTRSIRHLAHLMGLKVVDKG